MENINSEKINSLIQRGGRLLRWPDVQARVGICRSYANLLVKQGEFPKPYKLTSKGRSVGWLEEDIDAWIERRVGTAKPHPAADDNSPHTTMQGLNVIEENSPPDISYQETDNPEEGERIEMIVNILLSLNGMKPPSQEELEVRASNVKIAIFEMRRLKDSFSDEEVILHRCFSDTCDLLTGQCSN